MANIKGISPTATPTPEREANIAGPEVGHKSATLSRLLVVLAVLLAGIGFLFLSQATMGVGLIALGCLAGILARIAQARAQHEELLRALSLRDGR